MDLGLEIVFEALREASLPAIALGYDTARGFGIGGLLGYTTNDEFELGLVVVADTATPFALSADLYFATGQAGGTMTLASTVCAVLVTNGEEIPVESWQCSQEVNGAWQWQASLPYDRAIDFAEGQLFQIHSQDANRNPLNCPPLVANSPRSRRKDVGSGWTTRLAGTDAASWRMTLPGQSWPTFQKVSVASIIAAIASRAGVSILGGPAWMVFEEDIKQSDLWAALLRIAEVEAANLVIDPSGNIRFVPVGWASSECEFFAESVEELRDPSRRVTSIKFAKRLAAAAAGEQSYQFDSVGWRVVQLKNELVDPGCADASASGKCVLVSFWEGDPGGLGARLVNFFDLGGGSVGDIVGFPSRGRATHMSLSVMPAQPPLDQFPIDATLLVQGTPPEQVPPGIDLAFETTIGTTDRPATSVRTESLYPSKAHVLGKASAYLVEANKSARQIEARGPVQYGAEVGQTMAFYEFPPARIERVEHMVSTQQTGTTLRGYVL